MVLWISIKIRCDKIQIRLLSSHAEVVTEFNQKHTQEVSELHDTVSSLRQEKLVLQQEASDMRKQLIAEHSSETTSLKHQLETTSTLEAQRFMQLEANLKHEMNELHNQLDVSEEARATAENNAKQYQSGGPEFEWSVNSEVKRQLQSDEFFQQQVQGAHVEMDKEEVGAGGKQAAGLHKYLPVGTPFATTSK
ncbi:hypothetical protein EV421DRAFT_1745430 [Armillaria borealis]|uniref:Uncharacterized protein n=1 Tax=Armillaria borealis TaxID=47425 RepID=A0AA39ITI0_9AGAR|nr:hypothetical protein EV421DRAFT_1745430 [Armillaria borealis]